MIVEYQRRAVQARARAQLERDATVRQGFINLALTCEALADTLERASTREIDAKKP
jgi:hypothetical protein